MRDSTAKRRGNAKRTRGAAASSPDTGPLLISLPMFDTSAPTPPASTCSAVASPARTCLSLGRELASRVNAAVCGASSRGSFASFDPASSSWKTSQRSFLAELETFSGRWPRAGMMLSGFLSALPTLALHTDESDSSSSRGAWPTADAGVFNLHETPESWKKRADSQGRGTTGAAPTLAVAVKMAAKEVVRGDDLSPAWVERLMGFPDGWTSPPTDGPSAPAKRSPKASRRASRKKGTSDGRG